MNSNNYLPVLLFLFSIATFSQVTEPDMIFVQGGDFQMGCVNQPIENCASDEKTVVRVSLYDFSIGKYEVTNAQFAEFLSAEGNQLEGGKSWYRMDKYALIEKVSEGFKVKQGFDNFPVNNISWYGAKAYAKWLSHKTGKRYRLPTEAEWEYAAKGGQNKEVYLHAGSDDHSSVGRIFKHAMNSKTGWGFGKDQHGTHPVGSKLPNALGIHDMTGNLGEWCSDFYDTEYSGGVNPTGPKSGSLAVLRGGSWDHGKMNSRVTTRFRSNLVSSFSANKGFRVVMEKDISKAIDSVMNKHGFQGVILVKKGGQIVYHNSFGMANQEKNVSHSNDTPYMVASITKLVTSTIILQLVEEGKIDLQNTIGTYLPEYKGEGKNKVTVHQLLNHTSGILSTEADAKNLKDDEVLKIFSERATTDELLHRYCSGELVNEPGSTFYYNNGDYIVLGKIIEHIEKDTYENVLQKRIFKPLRMTNSGLITNENVDQLTNLAQGYTLNKETKTLQKDGNRLLQNFYASGAMYSTAKDLAKFSDALFFKRTLLNETSLESLLMTHPETKNYGYGLWMRFRDYKDDKTIVKVAERYGRIFGINTLFSYVFDHDISVITLSNTNKINPWSVNNFVHKQFLD